MLGKYIDKRKGKKHLILNQNALISSDAKSQREHVWLKGKVLLQSLFVVKNQRK